MSMKNSSDTIGNRTHDLPACSAVPQPLSVVISLYTTVFKTKNFCVLPTEFSCVCVCFLVDRTTRIPYLPNLLLQPICSAFTARYEQNFCM